MGTARLKVSAKPTSAHEILADMVYCEKEIPALFKSYQDWKRKYNEQNPNQNSEVAISDYSEARSELDKLRIRLDSYFVAIREDGCTLSDIIFNPSVFKNAYREAAKILKRKGTTFGTSNELPNCKTVYNELMNAFSTSIQNKSQVNLKVKPQTLAERLLRKRQNTVDSEFLEIIPEIAERMVQCAQYGMFEASIEVTPYFDEILKRILTKNKFKVDFSDDSYRIHGSDIVCHVATVRWNRSNRIIGALSQAAYEKEKKEVVDAILHDVRKMLQLVQTKTNESYMKKKLNFFVDEFDRFASFELTLPLLKEVLKQEGIKCDLKKTDDSRRYLLSLSW